MNDLNQMKLVKCPKCNEIDTQLNTFLGLGKFNCLNCDFVFSLDQINLNNVSDGYYTFDELYFHRMILFSVICKQNENKAWKSKLHADGTMFKNYFIVGIETKKGQYTYHYHIEFWNHFDGIKELKKAPKWDGHQPKDIDRLLSLYQGSINKRT